MRPLQDRIAVVTGASRGAGKGIAQALGEAGATVYVTGRSSAATGSTHDWPGTIEATAAAVTAAGGVGIPVQVDHGDERQVVELFERIGRDHGRLDLLVNNAWSAHDAKEDLGIRPFWQIPTRLWQSMIDGGARLGLLTSTHAVPLMLGRGRGLIVNTTFWDHDQYTGNLYYDLAKAVINRLAFDMAQDLQPHGIAAVAVSPGWMRTELVLQAFDADEAHWQDHPALAATESPLYLGRAVAALAADPAVMARSGQCLTVGELAQQYGFTDVDGRQPPPFRVAAVEEP